ncbi:hypothetical protein MNV49_001613 [Pseudohyphozyma bogoriensis]|nr:hypothetical protein MNV49_001613 [Pseudohyphozyma bogoriensis]
MASPLLPPVLAFTSPSDDSTPPRRSFSDIVPPPHLSSFSLQLDPFLPFDKKKLDEDDDQSSAASSDVEFMREKGELEREGAALSGGAAEYVEDSDEMKDENARLVDSNASGLELGGGARSHWAASSSSAKTRRRRFFCFLFLFILFSVLVITSFGSHWFSGKHSYHGQGLKPISWQHVANGTFYPERKEFDWLGEAGDGVYSYRTQDGSIVLEDVTSNSSRVLVAGEDITDSRGAKLEWTRFKVSQDLKYVLFDADHVKQWRHSSHANFYVHTISTGQTVPLQSPTFPPHTAYTTFSPVDHHIAFVRANDLYVYENPPKVEGEEAIRVTVDGSPTTFNGVPDWVYEEEVYSADSTLWWSPDGQRLAFLSFDEQNVPEYEFPIYNSDHWRPGAEPYPTSTVMRYPKPGYPNPFVKLQVFDLLKFLSLPSPASPIAETSPPTLDPRVLSSTYSLRFENAFDANDVVITEVTWVGKEDLMVKATNRIGNHLRVWRFVVGLQEAEEGDKEIWGKVVREVDFEKVDGGWVESDQSIVGIDSTIALHSAADAAAPIPTYPPGYLDVVPNSQGFNHIAYYSPPDAAEPVFLTEGQWEVDGNIEAVDVKRGYFIAANPSIERHLYSVPLPSTDALAKLKAGEKPEAPTALSDTKERGFHRTSFSPFAGFYVLSYEGPGIPWQRLVKVDDKDFKDVLTDNAQLAKVDADFMKAEITYTTVETEGYALNVMELKPPMMDVSGRTKYPVLFSVYGGPNSQKVQTVFARDWHHFLCTSMNYIIVFVDPRGTGFKGREFRMPVRNRLGILEANDTIAVARHYAAQDYIDEKRVGIWGWSYGGFLTTKIIEANSSVFTLGMAVAPVTDWRYYDSIYTERYMSTPKLNQAGYDASAITRMDGFKNADYALAHGSGDDNVHFLNTAALLDRLSVARVKGYRFRMFTDSDHSMGMRGAYWTLMEWLTDYLGEKWGEGGRTKTKWKSMAHEVARD